MGVKATQYGFWELGELQENQRVMVRQLKSDAVACHIKYILKNRRLVLFMGFLSGFLHQ